MYGCISIEKEESMEKKKKKAKILLMGIQKTGTRLTWKVDQSEKIGLDEGKKIF